MKEIQSELGRLKTGIDEAKGNVSKLEGREEELLKQLKTEFGLASVEAAEKEMVTLKKQSETKEIEIQKQFAELKETYEW